MNLPSIPKPILDRAALPHTHTHTHLGDGECLLFHDLMEHRARAVAHLVELVDAADAVVTEHQRARLQHQLPRLGVLHDVRRQTHGARALARGVLPAGHQVEDVLQQLRLAGARVATEQDVDLGTEVAAPRLGEVLSRAAEKLQEDSLWQKEDDVSEWGKKRSCFTNVTD